MGGRWQSLDHLRQGRVSCIRLPETDSATGNIQAQAVLAELQRLKDLEQRADWQGCAVLARTHRYLLPIQAWCEQNSVPYYLAADKQSALPLTRQRGYIKSLSTYEQTKRLCSMRTAQTLICKSYRSMNNGLSFPYSLRTTQGRVW